SATHCGVRHQKRRGRKEASRGRDLCRPPGVLEGKGKDGAERMRDRSEFDDLAPLIKLIRAHPPFDRETELVVTRKARKGDKRAQEKLVVHNLSLVISVARKFMGAGGGLGALFRRANYALFKAINTSTPGKANGSAT